MSRQTRRSACRQPHEHRPGNCTNNPCLTGTNAIDTELGTTPKAVTARSLTVTGRVQGVGFRPFVYRLAATHGLTGWVLNRLGQVEIRVQGAADAIRRFEHELIALAPPLARPQIDASAPAETGQLYEFTIRESSTAGAASIHVPPDLFTCNDCLHELNDPADRRYRYPFINCTQCGPRYTLIRSLPYDRPNTTMAGFTLCPQCLAEYTNPTDRRFHAEPLACPACGPALSFASRDGTTAGGNEAALRACIAALRGGDVVAVKGIGGYHLLCDAGSNAAVTRLRQRKPRPHKPLAVMFPAPPASPLDAVLQYVILAPEARELLLSPARPIVLATQRPGTPLSGRIAPGLNEIGVMLPYSPLHHLLLNDYGAPLVATSANISGEPVLTDNREVDERLAHVADACLHHDRPVERPADDPVYRSICNTARPIRLGRGATPQEESLPFHLPQPVIAVGGHMKNTVALAWESRLVVSPHIGDMGTARSLAVFEQTIADLQSLYGVTAERVIHDAHPGYATTRWAERSGLPRHAVLHHHAHAATACDLSAGDAPWLVFTWDGVGYGADGTLWGGEALLGHPGNWERVASLRPFHLPGGERAGREPWRSAAAVCWETGLDWSGLPQDTELLRHAWERRMNTPQTSAAGRLFDAAAALAGLCRDASFEGQGPMLLEAACKTAGNAIELPLEEIDGLWLSDWAPLLPMLMDTDRPVAARAADFHASLAHALLLQSQRLRDIHGVTRIGLAGGVFQNRRLTERTAELLETNGFNVYIPAAIPVNDAGLSTGQVIEYGFGLLPDRTPLGLGARAP